MTYSRRREWTNGNTQIVLLALEVQCTVRRIMDVENLPLHVGAQRCAG